MAGGRHHERGRPMTMRAETRGRATEFLMLRSGGCTLTEIGDMAGITHQAVSQLLRQLTGSTPNRAHRFRRVPPGKSLYDPLVADSLGLPPLRRLRNAARKRRRVIRALALFKKVYGRTPWLPEMAKAFGCRAGGSNPSSWVSSYIDEAFGRPGIPERVTRARLYSRLGLTPPPVGRPPASAISQGTDRRVFNRAWRNWAWRQGRRR